MGKILNGIMKRLDKDAEEAEEIANKLKKSGLHIVHVSDRGTVSISWEDYKKTDSYKKYFKWFFSLIVSIDARARLDDPRGRRPAVDPTLVDETTARIVELEELVGAARA